MIPRAFENLIVFNQPPIVQPCVINGEDTELLFDSLKHLCSHPPRLVSARPLTPLPPCGAASGRAQRPCDVGPSPRDDASAPRRRRCPSLPMRRCAWPLLRLPARAGLALRHGGAAASRLRPAASAAASSAAGGDGGARAPDTSLFVPVPLKPAGDAADEDVGAELTRPLDKGECGRP